MTRQTLFREKMQNQKFALLLLATFVVSGFAPAIQPAAAASFNNVQVFASISPNQSYNFAFAAYNLSGSLVASYQGPFPAAAFELPAGGYLFTASATHFTPFKGYACPVVAGAPTPAPASSPKDSGSAMPISCNPPSSWYGYQSVTVTGSQTINIQMQNVSKLPTTSVTVKVSYVNGTAASDASVYASIVGEWYYWYGQNNGITMNAQTDSNGVAHLVIPAAPSVITAWKWVPVFDARNRTSVITNVGGEKVNVTMYWEPTYVGLSGSGLLIPPQNSLSITLHYQQPDYWIMPMGVNAKGAFAQGGQGATVASQPTGAPSLASSASGAQGNQYYLPAQIPAIQQSGAAQVPTTAASISSLWTIGAVAAILAIAGAAAAMVVTRRRKSGRLP
jgi:hypothetical protein